MIMAIDFNDSQTVIYTPANWDSYHEGADGLTGHDFYTLCNKDISLAERVYYLCSSQHPSEVLNELNCGIGQIVAEYSKAGSTATLQDAVAALKMRAEPTLRV